MWVIWFGPVVVVFFLAGMTIAAVLLRLGKLRSPRAALGAVALPFGFAALPVLGLALLSLGASYLAPDDRALYAEMFGPGPQPNPDRTLFDAFGQGPTREILLRLEPTAAQSDHLMALPGLAPSAMTPAAFETRGTRHALATWWMHPTVSTTARRTAFSDCRAPAIYQADGFNGWHELRLARCAPVQGDAPLLFVTTLGR